MQGTRAETRQQELANARRLEGAMREVAMIAGRDAEHPHEVKCAAQRQGDAVHAREEYRHAGQVPR